MRRLTLGRVAGVFGIKGWVKLRSFTRPEENLLEFSRWWLLHKGREYEVRLIDSRMQLNGPIALISDEAGNPITDRDVAESMIGAEIQVAREELPEPAEGEYYWADLIGVRVVNEQGVELGVIDEMTSNGPQDVMVVKLGEVERLIPFIKEVFVKSVDLKEGVIVADWQPDF